MESIPLFFQGSSTATIAAPEMKEDRQSLQDAAVADFSALLVSLLMPVQPLPESLAAMTPQQEGTDQPAASSDKEAAPEAAVISLLVAPPADLRTTSGKDTHETGAITTVSTGKPIHLAGSREAPPRPATASKAAASPVIATPTGKVEGQEPAENRREVKSTVIAEGPAQQVPPDSEVLLRLVPVTMGTANEPGFKLVASDMSDLSDLSGAKVVSLPLSAIDNGQITLPVQLPSGEQVTLVLRDMPNTASGPKDPNPAIMVQSAKPAKPADPAEFVVGHPRATGAPDAPRETIQVVQQERQAPASVDVIRIILQVKPSEATQEAPKAAPINTAQALPVQSGTPAADSVRELPLARPTAFFSQPSETPQFRGVVENEGDAKGVATTPATRQAPSTYQPVPVKIGEVPEIRVLNQSSRQVEIVVQQGPAANATEVQGAQAASRPAVGTSGEKTSRVEFDAVEAKLPGRPEKAVLLADAVSGKEAVSALTTPAGSVEKLPDQPVQSSRETSADTIIDQVMQKFSPANRTIPSEVTVKLQPEHLGNLQMKVSVDGEQVALKIQVETPVAKQMLENNLGQLRDSFSSLGLRMDSVSVSLGMNTGWDRGQNALWQDGRGNNAHAMRQNEPEPNRREQSASLARAYPVRVDRLLDMTI